MNAAHTAGRNGENLDRETEQASDAGGNSERFSYVGERLDSQE
jgi:hypothetical protein